MMRRSLCAMFCLVMGAPAAEPVLHATSPRGQVWVDGQGKIVSQRPQPAPSGAPSPDGKQFTFSELRDGDHEIVVIDADGNNRRELTTNDSRDDMPCWAPDGRTIVFASDRSGTWRLYAVPSVGGPDAIVETGGKNAWRPQYSKDGKLAWLEPGRRLGKVLPQNLSVKFNLETITLERQQDISDFAFSPDGSKIVWAYADTLVVYDFATRKTTRQQTSRFDRELFAHAAYELVWKPDGSAFACRIRFLGGLREGAKVAGENEVFVFPLDGQPSRFPLPDEYQLVGWSAPPPTR